MYAGPYFKTLSSQTPNRDFKAVYLDTNVLLRGQGWPVPSILLNNLFRLAALCGVQNCIPEPVIKEAEEHWLRQMNDSITKLTNAKREMNKSSGPVQCEIKLDHPTIGELMEEYRKQVGNAVKEYDIIRTPFTRRETAEIFGFATRYIQPFAHKSEGRGFQDAVILLSILDHLGWSADAAGLFVTSDEDFAGVTFEPFTPGFDPARLKVLGLEDAVDYLSKRYYQEAVVKPYKVETENALAAAEELSSEILEFVKSHLSADMMKPSLSGTVTKLLSVQSALVISVETPVPEPDAVDRSVEVLIRVVAECQALMTGGIKGGALQALSQLMHSKDLEFFPSTEEREAYTIWRGGIKAIADVVDRKFKNIKFLTLIPEDTPLGSEPAASLQRGFSPELWLTRRLEKKIVEGFKILPGETPARTGSQIGSKE